MNLSIIKKIFMLRKVPLLVLVVIFGLTLSLQLLINLYFEPRLEKLRIEWQKQRETDSRGSTLQNREKLYKKGLADLARFDEHIYLKSQFARFISELYDLAANNRLELSAISYKPSLNKIEQVLTYELVMTASGKYPNLKKFINDLGSATNILVIDSISLASTAASVDTVQLQIKITSFFRMEGP